MLSRLKLEEDQDKVSQCEDISSSGVDQKHCFKTEADRSNNKQDAPDPDLIETRRNAPHLHEPDIEIMEHDNVHFLHEPEIEIIEHNAPFLHEPDIEIIEPDVPLNEHQIGRHNGHRLNGVIEFQFDNNFFEHAVGRMVDSESDTDSAFEDETDDSDYASDEMDSEQADEIESEEADEMDSEEAVQENNVSSSKD